jgi:multicomponent Na+:H+ antiporter subunit E
MTRDPGAPRQESPREQVRFLVVEGLVLMALWLLLSGFFDAFHLAMGLASVAFVLWINRPVRAVELDPQSGWGYEPMHLPRLALYLPWLLWQMLASGLYVAYLSFQPKPKVAPLILRFRSHQPTLPAQVFLGNSITLTPGTLTLDIKGDELTVHALTPRTAAGFLDGTMPRRVAWLYGATPEQPVTDVRFIRKREELGPR